MMARFGVSIEKDRDLRQQMHQMGVYEKDLEERFIRSSGPGGQNLNKVSTCVSLVHIPSGIQVKCQAERTQGLNRYRARIIILEKLAKVRYQEKMRDIQKREKRRRQRRKRSKEGKEAMLENKRKQSEKKRLRRKVSPERE